LGGEGSEEVRPGNPGPRRRTRAYAPETAVKGSFSSRRTRRDVRFIGASPDGKGNRYRFPGG